MAKLSPVFNDQTLTTNGDPAVGYKLFAYAAGSSTKQTTFSDEDGTVPNSNPIILNNDGWPTQGPIWLTEGVAYKFVLALPTDTDPPTSPVKTFDNITGVGDNTVSVSQWVGSGTTATYVTPTTFTVLGDLTSEFHLGRMLQLQTTGGTVYGKIIGSVFTTLTTVTMQMNPGQVLDGGLSTVNLSLLRADNPALPNPIEYMRSTVAATPTGTPLWSRANGEMQAWTGAPTITDFPPAPRPGAVRWVFPTAGTTFTNGGNLIVQGNANRTTAAGDMVLVIAETTTTFRLFFIQASGNPLVLNYATVADALAGISQTLLMTPFAHAGATTMTRPPYVSPDQVITNSGLLTLPHGLTMKPKMVQTSIKCLVASNGFSVGEEVILTDGYDSPNLGVSMWTDATNINVRFATGGLSIVPKAGGTGVVITNANWAYIVRAYA